MMQTTTVILTRNSERTVARALRSAVDLTDAVQVFDTGSTDATREVVAAFPEVKWNGMEWHDSFSRARNDALDCIRDGLVVFLDSDEWLDGNATDCAALLRGLDDPTACWSPVVKDISGMSMVHNLPRILRADGPLRFRYRVHERLFHGEEECWPRDIPLDFCHDGYTTEALERFGKQDRNLQLLSRDLEEYPGDPERLFFWLRDGMDARGSRENRDLVAKIDRQSVSRGDTPRRFPVLARKVLLADEWARRGAHPETVQLAFELAGLSPEDPDAAYVIAVDSLIEHHRQMRDQLQSLALLRSGVGNDDLQWGLSPKPWHLDAAISEYLRTLGDPRASEYAREIGTEWTDIYFENSSRRGLSK